MSVWEDIKSAWNKVAYVFTDEYRKNVEHYVYLEKNASKFKLKDSGTDFDETIERLEKNGIKPEFHIDFSIKNKQEVESQHQKFTESLKPEQSNSEDEEYGELLKKAQLHPLMPSKYNAVKRAKLREFERELLTGSKDNNVKPTINVESDKSSIKQENYKKLEDEYKMYILKQLDNVLRGDELRVREDNKESPENKKIHTEVIEGIKKYLNNYDENMKYIHQAKKYNERMEDDLR